ncbi:unnamed protein product [Arabidopsis thaliana]|uniref:Nuclear polyadenylated RNA-binding protein n=3 Tax=Arabidopsis TaxID=3701 RepID=Q9FGQ0_ARATH|nr:nuclear polyadenylated RNA-binding protein [Arabidopsis thaliana]KAG7612553.1 hypothetical protein ISN44_As05g045610 [Arabidopsis suecica]AAO42257.1 unknown protein [Arabidopsis thaliana]AAO63936.1 unknown protein [Arabidopsis thaliana]AED95997.1 nuclear polyadenylated RNA-binding protein [Arabidopsis thaliana]VYS69943.1 unnamed protein product [Arabidopsis thaliana]|eukprot:NP_199896.1 nuclear polyadenylated RNA-binding protein [Arabidopsis thaliana]
MGCGGSRLGGVATTRAEEGGVVPLPAGIRPLLRRRLEEMKKRSHAGVLKGSQTLSKKELLRHNSSEDGEDTEENDGSLKASAKVAPAPDHNVEEKKEVIYEKIPSKDDVKEVKEEVVVNKQEEDNHHQDVVEKQEEENKEVVKKQEEENHDDDVVVINVKKEGDDGKNHDVDEGSINNFDERMIGPGSPSFRVYCVDVPSDDDDEEKDVEDARKSMETESVTTEIKEDGSIVKKEKKERRGKRFGIALPRKYLANVTAPCYAGGGCMGNTHSRLVQEKSSQ